MSLQLAFAAPVALALVGAVLSLAAEAVERERLSIIVSSVALGAAAVIALVGAATVAPGAVWGVFVSGAGYSMAACVIMALGALACVTSLSAPEKGRAALCGLISISAAALAVLAAANDIIVMVVALETAAVVGYALVALARTPRASEAAMKYFVQGAVATAVLVLGIAAAVLAGVLVPAGGGLSSVLSGSEASAAMIAIALVFAAFAFKLGAFPFHSWAPDTYETAPPEAAAFLSSAVKVGVLVAVYTLLTSVLAQEGLLVRVQWLVAGIAAASVVFGNLAALAQRSYTRLLAYSGIAQVGYGLTAIVTGNGNAALLFVSAYGCAAAGAFAAARAYRSTAPDWDGSIAGMAGFARRAPVLSAALAVLLFSLTGIPPLFGFWGKFLVFLSAAAATSPSWVWLAVVGLLGSVVSFGYYGYVLKTVYFDDSAPEGETSAKEPAAEVLNAAEGDSPSGRESIGPATWVVIGLAAVLLVGGLVPLIGGLTRLVGIDPPGFFTLGPF